MKCIYQNHECNHDHYDCFNCPENTSTDTFSMTNAKLIDAGFPTYIDGPKKDLVSSPLRI
jgi:hypothetical protein